jgi:hypothetical protein
VAPLATAFAPPWREALASFLVGLAKAVAGRR